MNNYSAPPSPTGWLLSWLGKEMCTTESGYCVNVNTFMDRAYRTRAGSDALIVLHDGCFLSQASQTGTNPLMHIILDQLGSSLDQLLSSLESMPSSLQPIISITSTGSRSTN